MARKAMHLNLKKNALHEQMGVKKGEKIPKGKLVAACRGGKGIEKKRACAALNFESWNHKGSAPKKRVRRA